LPVTSPGATLALPVESSYQTTRIEVKSLTATIWFSLALGHRLAQGVAYGDLGGGDPAPITPDYERQADPVVELHLGGRA
jgi:hypothetical protein